MYTAELSENSTNMSASKEEPIPMQPRFYSGVYFETDFVFSDFWRLDDNISDVLLKLTFLYRAFLPMWLAFMKIYCNWRKFTEKGSTPTELIWDTNMAAVPLFFAATSCNISHWLINRCANIRSGKKYSKVMLKINWSLKVPLHRLSMEVACFGICLALNSVIYSRITLFFIFNYTCSKSRHSCSKLRHFSFKSHHFCSILHRFCFGYKRRYKTPFFFQQTGY